MKGFVGVTNNEWFKFLADQPGIDEVNFWQPGGQTHFKSLKPGEPFFFKLHKPYERYIGGVGFFAHSTIVPISVAWQAFEEKNGASSYLKMRQLIEQYRQVESRFEDYKIGCIILAQPFFFPREQWVHVPNDFSLNIVRGKTYDLTVGHGFKLWNEVQARLSFISQEDPKKSDIVDPGSRYGKPTLVAPRLGQGAFRVMVTDAYERRCAVTQERILPALEAAHIKPFSESGPNAVENGILLRSDIHRLFDSGYVTVTDDHHFEVSKRIKEDFDNGEHYRTFHGHRIHIPPNRQFAPGREFLSWHNENVFKA